ncbi:MAG TPA: UDP-N-acetylglucosamine 2-epimerase (non-hydrolyzing) [Gammaproteobacteria bacterium]|nr:UDP-N-acetylglucosamine 2-epimerase (non-hydrolyzing) [Gammaproteobacteria bacterium]
MSSSEKKEILCIVGARPNFTKIAPIIAAMKAKGKNISPYLLHTGQHYDEAMKASFFKQLGIPEPDVDLEVGSGSHAVQTADVMKKFEPVLDERNPAAVLVVGDVNSTIACALVAAKKGIPVIHVESGLRSYDREMPEEINRVLTDQISDLLFTTERSAHANLQKEGITEERVVFVGNVMIDTLFKNVEKAIPMEQTLSESGVENNFENGFGLITMHRPSNVDDEVVLTSLIETLVNLSKELPLIFPVHPRTKGHIEKFGLLDKIQNSQIILLPPLGYLHLLGFMKNAKVVLTDSGGIQEETTALGVPCITLRENTERPITIAEGTNTIVGSDPDKIIEAFNDVMSSGGKAGRVPEYWDGKAAERIVDYLDKWVEER